VPASIISEISKPQIPVGLSSDGARPEVRRQTSYFRQQLGLRLSWAGIHQKIRGAKLGGSSQVAKRCINRGG
jgi:hypothetical protein